MAQTYYSQILHGWYWDKVVEDARRQASPLSHDDHGEQDGCDDDGHVGMAFLGTVYNITPSGKFYMPWTTNQTERDADRDARWFYALDKVIQKFGGWRDGDGEDILFARYFTKEELDD